MIDEKLLQRITTLAEIKSTDIILEIGPGTGNLTKYLLQKAKHVYAIEKDQKLISLLKERYTKKITYIEGDASRIPFPHFTKCISNLPYTICEPLLWKLTRSHFDALILVAPEKFSSRFVGEKPSRLSLLRETFYTLECKETIPPTAFHPKPKVNSALIKLTPKKTEGFLREFLSQYDKKTKNALETILCKNGKTKKHAQEIIMLKIPQHLQEKTILSLSLKEIEEMQTFFPEKKSI